MRMRERERDREREREMVGEKKMMWGGIGMGRWRMRLSG